MPLPLVLAAGAGLFVAGSVAVKVIGDEVEDFTGKTLPNVVIWGGIGLAIYSGYKTLSKR